MRFSAPDSQKGLGYGVAKCRVALMGNVCSIRSAPRSGVHLMILTARVC
jgi:hypothetical protein